MLNLLSTSIPEMSALSMPPVPNVIYEADPAVELAKCGYCNSWGLETVELCFDCGDGDLLDSLGFVCIKCKDLITRDVFEVECEFEIPASDVIISRDRVPHLSSSGSRNRETALMVIDSPSQPNPLAIAGRLETDGVLIASSGDGERELIVSYSPVELEILSPQSPVPNRYQRMLARLNESRRKAKRRPKTIRVKMKSGNNNNNGRGKK